MQIKCHRLVQMTECYYDKNKKVNYLLPGEVAHLDSPKKEWINETDVLDKSPHRIRIKCPKFYQCGGCDFLHVSLDYQSQLKTDYLKQLFKEHHLEGGIYPIIPCERPLGYRHKTVLSALTVHGKLKLGLFQKNSKVLFPFLSCYLHHPEANQVFKTVEDTLNLFKIKAYDYEKNQGMLKHVMIRTSYKTQEMILILVTQGDVLPKAKEIAKTIMEKHPKVKTVVHNIHHKKTSLILQDKEKIIAGLGYIEDEIFNVRFRLSSQSFYQANPIQMMKLYAYALDQAVISPDDCVLDAYSGIGTLSLLASKKAKKVYAIESNKKAHQDGLFNKKLNQMDHVEFILGDVSKIIHEFHVRPDVVIMDPPREGSTPSFLNALLHLKPKRIIYISCEPQALVRDLAVLKSQYSISTVQAFDMFPQTKHVESITLLSLKIA